MPIVATTADDAPLARDGTGVALCIASAAGFGTTTIFVTLAYRAHVGELPLLALRFALCAVLLAGIVARVGIVSRPYPVRRSMVGAFLLGLVIISV